MKFDPEKHHRHSIRLKGYDYSAAGGYYVTVVALWRECLFGEVSGGEMRLNALGEIVREEWFKTAALRPYVQLREDEFMVMPNQVHGIIWIMDDAVGARRRRALTEEHFGKPMTGSLPTIVRAFKSTVTYRAGRELQSANIWQRNYHEHILRDQTDYERIANYIASNPVNCDENEKNHGSLDERARDNFQIQRARRITKVKNPLVHLCLHCAAGTRKSLVLKRFSHASPLARKSVPFPA